MRNLVSFRSKGPSILSKLMYVIMLTVVVILLLTGFVLSFNEWSVFRKISYHSISTLSGVIGDNSMAALAFDDAKVGKEILSALRSEPDVLLGCLYSKNRNLFASYIRSDYLSVCSHLEPEHGHIFDKGMLSFSRPIVHDNEYLGSFYMLSDMHLFKDRLKLYFYLLTSFLMIAVLVAYAMANRLQHLVIGPVLKLADTAKYISEEKQYSLRAEKSADVEIDVLVTSFNRMLDVIQEREQTIQESEEQFRAAFDLAAVGHLLLGPDGKFLRVNPELCKILEYSSEELLELRFTDITHPDDFKGSGDVFKKIFQKEINSISLEKRYLTKSGSVIWAIVSAASIRDSSGTVTKIISVFQNITERKRAERERDRLLDFERDARIEIERSVHVRDDFLAIASHELRTPITPLKIYLAMMKNILIKLEPDLIKNQKTLVQTCINSQTQLDSLEKLIEDLLSVTRISAGRLQLARTDVNLSLLVAHVLNRYAEVSSKAGCKINYVCDENVIGYWDPLRIEQIVINIFSNALKYGAGNPIEVSVTKVNRKAKFVVLDHGIGMTREELSKIFQKFERGGSVKSFGGLGLGLFITKGYVTAHQGSIYAESKLHEGSIFTVELPLELERV